MNCPHCQAELPENTAFCTSCGKETAAAPSAPASPAEPPSQAAAPEPKRRDALHPASAGADSSFETATYNETPVNPRDPMSVFGFIGMIILMAIPILNIIMIIRWSFSKTVNINKRHYGIASIIVFVLALILAVTLAILFPGIYRPLFDMLASLFLIG